MPKQDSKQATAPESPTADPLAKASDVGAPLKTQAQDPASAMLDPGGIVVTSPSGTRRRAGFAFGPHETHVTTAELTEEVAEAIATDPFLVVRPYRPAVGEAAAAEAAT